MTRPAPQRTDTVERREHPAGRRERRALWDRAAHSAPAGLAPPRHPPETTGCAHESAARLSTGAPCLTAPNGPRPPAGERGARVRTRGARRENTALPRAAAWAPSEPHARTHAQAHSQAAREGSGGKATCPGRPTARLTGPPGTGTGEGRRDWPAHPSPGPVRLHGGSAPCELRPRKGVRVLTCS